MKNLLTSLFLLLILIPLNAQIPDRVFYSSMRPEGWDIYLAPAPGEAFKKFTEHPSLDYDATIDPEGKYIVFTSERDGYPKLWIKPIDGISPARLLLSSNSMQDQADISPDGKWIIFVSSHNGDAEIYKLPFLPDSLLDISHSINLTNNKAGDFRPSFSPDGSHIVFSSTRDHELLPHNFFSFAVHRTGDVYKMKSDGSDVVRLTQSNSWDGSPVFSADGKKIFFYSERSGDACLYKMNPNGSDVVQINLEGPKTISPTLYNDKIISSSFLNDNGLFNLSVTEQESGKTKKLYEENIDMLNPKAHSSGMLVFHGGPKPERSENNRGGFRGDLLVKNSPVYQVIDDQPVQSFAVRRAFAAPPSPFSSTIIIDEFFMDNPLADVKPPAFGGAILLLGILILAIAGLILAIVHRKKIRFWRYLLFSLASILIFLTAFGSFFYFHAFKGLALSQVRTNLLITGCFFLIFTWWTYKIWQKRKTAGKDHFRVSRILTWSLGLATVFTIYTAFFNFWFFDVRSDFYEVNYLTNETKHLFKINPDIDFNPSNRQVLDMKYNPDGTGFILSLGRFGTGPEHQGDIYEYNFETKEAVKITDSDANDGFGGYSADMQHFIYRSGHNGTMDLFLRSGNETIQLTNTPAKENFPVISLQGDKIIFCTDESAVKRENDVRTMDIYLLEKTENGWSDPVQLTNAETLEAHPHFSPNGEWIIYTTEEFGIMDEQPLVQHYIFAPQMYGEIVAQRLSDGKKVRLTHNKWEEGAPIWEKGISTEMELTTPDVLTNVEE